MQFFSFIDNSQAQTVHEASLEILEEVGLLVRNEKARHRFAEFGAKVDHDSEIVKIPSAVVEHFRSMVPPTITFRARNPDYDITFPRELPSLPPRARRRILSTR